MSNILAFVAFLRKTSRAWSQATLPWIMRIWEEAFLDTLKQTCNGYLFCKLGADNIELVYNPLIVFNALEWYNNQGYLFDIPSISSLSDATHFFGTIARQNLVKYKDLIFFKANAPVEVNFKLNLSFSDILTASVTGHEAGCHSVACSLLYYLGALTHSPNGGLIVPNGTVQDVVCIYINFFFLFLIKLKNHN